MTPVIALRRNRAGSAVALAVLIALVFGSLCPSPVAAITLAATRYRVTLAANGSVSPRAIPTGSGVQLRASVHPALDQQHHLRIIGRPLGTTRSTILSDCPSGLSPCLVGVPANITNVENLWQFYAWVVDPLGTQVLGRSNVVKVHWTGVSRIGTDATWLVDGGRHAAPIRPDCIPGNWASAGAVFPAQWIWSSACMAGDAEAHTFSRTVVIDLPQAGITAATLDIAVDNYASVFFNGQRVPYQFSPVRDSPGSFQLHTLDVKPFLTRISTTGLLVDSISIEVHNFPLGTRPCASTLPGWCNPAGLLARLVID